MSFSAGRIVAAGALIGALATVAWLGGDEAEAVDPGEFAFRYREVAAEAGIDFLHRAPELDPRLDPVAPHVAGLGAGVSVADADRDGYPDLYFVTGRFGAPNALFLGSPAGTFRDAAAAAGVADLNVAGEGASMGSVWGDVDNDGDEDLFVYRWGTQVLLENLLADTGRLRFRDVSTAAGLDLWMNANGAVWFDYDRDGLLDLYVAAYFREEVDLWNLTSTRIMQNSFEFATNGGRNRLFRNLGGMRFEDVTERTGVGSTRWTLAAAAADLNEDGWPDLYLANDYGPEELYLNREGREFELLRGAGLEDDSKSGMSVSLGDIHGRGRFDVFVTNISEPGYLLQGNNLRVNMLADMGMFLQVAEGQVADAGWAWGAQFGDVDNDGDDDLFITNGFISASPERDYWYGMSKIAGATGAIFEDASTWPPIGDASLSGYERSRLLLNSGTGLFTDVAPAVGIEDTYDGRAIAFLDLRGDGALDAVVANQNGPALLYRNTVAPGRHWIGFELEGTRSNRSAIGAEVIVEFGDRRMRRIVDGGMGFCSQNDRRLHFGLGGAERADRVEIRWPSGLVQELRGLEIDRRHRIVEPAADGEPEAEGEPR